METFVYTLGPAAGVLVTLTALIKLEEWRRLRVGEAPSIREKLLRPPGYSARKKAEELVDLATTRGITCFAASIALGYYLSRGPLKSIDEIATAILLAIGIALFFGLIFDPLRKARAYRLGATGEEFMAHVGLASHLRRIKSTTLRSIPGRPLRRRDFQRQNIRNPRRCQSTTVSGRTITSACGHPAQVAFIAIQKRRSHSRILGRRTVCRSKPS